MVSRPYNHRCDIEMASGPVRNSSPNVQRPGNTYGVWQAICMINHERHASSMTNRWRDDNGN